MTPAVPPSFTIFALASTDLLRTMTVSTANLTAATFIGKLTDSFDNEFLIDNVVFDLGDYVAGNSSGGIVVAVPRATVSQLPVGTGRFWIAMSTGSGYYPAVMGPFLVSGPATGAGYISTSLILPGGTGPFTIYGSIQVVSAATVTLMNEVQEAFHLVSMDGLVVSSGGFTLSVLHNGSPVTGMANVAISTSPVNLTPTGGDLAIAVGDSLEMTLSGVSGGTSRFAFALSGTKP